jgi:hypothetical protein
MPHVRKPTFDRRAVLWGAARGAKLLAAGGILSAAPFLRLAAQSRMATPASEPLGSPQEIRSRDGVLQATLTAAAGPVRLGAHQFSGFLYNGAYLPPLLRVQLGDTVRITFRNALPSKPSNLHYHGMSVSPQGNSDNVFVHVHPGETFQYEVRTPPAGGKARAFTGITRTRTAMSTIRFSAACRALWWWMDSNASIPCCADCRSVISSSSTRRSMAARSSRSTDRSIR